MRRRVVLAASSAIIAVLLMWALLPYIFPPDYHAVDIIMEERNKLTVSFIVGEEVKALLPTDLVELSGYPYVYFEAGLGHLNITGKIYDYVFASFYVQIQDMPGGPQVYAPPFQHNVVAHRYVLGFFTNNIELGEFFQSYGLPHTYVQATYSCVSEGSMNRTLLSMRHPNGSLFLEISALTSKTVEEVDFRRLSSVNWYHLNGNNLAIIHQSTRSYTYNSGYGHVNITFSERSDPWRFTGKIVHTIMRYVSCLPVFYWEGRMGWIPL